MSDSTRTCFHCAHFKLCFLRHNLNGIIFGCHILNADNTDDTPGSVMDIYTATANACNEYEENPNA